MKALKLFKSN